MRRLVFALLAVILLAVPAGGDDRIKVLIQDKGFQKVPEKSEKMAKLDSVRGSLKLGHTTYHGNIEVWQSERGLYLINEVPLEEYVEGVVKAETGKDWAFEALKAQAVIVRTYVLRQKMKSGGQEFHVTSSVLHQLYKGENGDAAVAEAVRQTQGEVLTYGGEPIMAYYHSTSCGTTESPEEVFGESYPYLRSVEASGKLSPYSLWTRRIPLEEIERATGVQDLREVRVKTRSESGRADQIALLSPQEESDGTSPSNTTVRAKDLRRMLGWKRLPSTAFDVRTEGKTAVFEGSGYGHGVGLCQWTAQEMALEGRDYRSILSHFYPGAALEPHENLGL